MSFTWFSTLILIIIFTAVGIGVVRGMRRGLIRSSISVAILLISALIAGILAIPLSDIPTDLLYDVFIEETKLTETYREMIPSIDALTRLAIDALLTPFVFAVLLPFIRLAVALIVHPICRRVLSSKPNSSFTSPDPGSSPSYESGDAPFHARHDRALGGLVGGICTFLAVILFISPLAGTLSIAGEVNRNLAKQKLAWEDIGIKDSFITELDPFFNDATLGVLGVAGADFVFSACATSTLPNGHNVSLPHEIDVVSDFMPDIVNLLYSFEVEELTPDAAELDAIAEAIESSEVLKLVAVDIINAASRAWLRADSYLSLERPRCGNYFDAIITEILKVCAMSNENCVSADLRTLFNIYGILLENGVINSELTNEQLEALLIKEGFIESIKNELSKNPCMSDLVEKLSDTSLEIFSSLLKDVDLSSLEAQEFMQQICDQLNSIVGQPDFDISGSTESLTDAVIDYANGLGIGLPADVAQMAVDSLIRRFEGQTSITPDDLEELFEEMGESGYYPPIVNLPELDFNETSDE